MNSAMSHGWSRLRQSNLRISPGLFAFLIASMSSSRHCLANALAKHTRLAALGPAHHVYGVAEMRWPCPVASNKYSSYHFQHFNKMV